MASTLYQHRRRAAVDLEALQRAHPAPPEFFETCFLMEPDRIERIQEIRLRNEVERAARIPFYRFVWGKAGFDPSSVRSLKDLAQVPLYDVDDLRASVERAGPLGDYQAVTLPADAQRMSLRLFFSGGTTGKPRPQLYTPWDWQVMQILSARALWLAGVRPGDVVLNSWSYGTHIVGLVVDEALYSWLGCLPIATSTGQVTPTRRQLELAHEYEATSVVAIGDYLLAMAATARELGYDPQKDFAFKGFPGPAGGRSAAIEEAWGVPSYESYGVHETGWSAIECPERGGLHVMEDTAIVEIVDVETGQPLPDGELGNVVITSLHRTGNAQVRYNTLDLSRLYPRSKCACGSWFRKMDYFRGRSDTMVKLRGANVWPEAVGRVVTDHPRILNEYFVEAYTAGIRDEMRVMVETAEEPEFWPALQADLESLIRATIEVGIKVELCPPRALAARTGLGVLPKPVRFNDRRAIATMPGQAPA